PIDQCQDHEQVGEIAPAPSIDFVQPRRRLLALYPEGAPDRVSTHYESAEQDRNQVQVSAAVVHPVASHEQADENGDVHNIVGDYIERAAELALDHFKPRQFAVDAV